MNLQTKISNDLKQAITDRNKDRAEFLKVIVAELSRKSTKEVSDEEVIKELKRIKEGSIICGNMSEVSILEEYLPKMMSEDEIRIHVHTVIAGNNCESLKDLGKVMKILNLYGPTMDKAIASKIAKQLLTS